MLGRPVSGSFRGRQHNVTFVFFEDKEDKDDQVKHDVQGLDVRYDLFQT